MKLTKDKTSGVILAKVHGLAINTGTTSMKEARRIMRLASQLAPIAAQANLGACPTIKEAIEQWVTWLGSTAPPSTAANKTCYINAWARDRQVLGRPINQVTEADIDQWVNKGDAKAGTRRVKLAIVRSFFDWCSVKRFVAADVSRHVRVKMHLLKHEQKEKAERLLFTEKDLTALLNHIGKAPKLKHREFWTAAVILARDTGLRFGDICNLEWAAFTKPGQIIVWTDKRDTRVQLKLTTRAAQVIGQIPVESDTHCFPEIAKLLRNTSARAGLSVQFARLCKGAGIPGHTFHGLRHTYINDMVAQGKATPHISRLVGHTSLKTTEGYIHLRQGIEED